MTTEEGVHRVEADPRHREHVRPRCGRLRPSPLMRLCGQGVVRKGRRLHPGQRRSQDRRRIHRRVLDGRRYSEGLHQAIEAKEGVASRKRTRRWPPSPSRTTSACTTSWPGMTGTAETEEAEFRQIYGSRLLSSQRTGQSPAGPSRSCLQSEPAKFNAVVDDIAERHERGQPFWSEPSRSKSPSGSRASDSGAGVKHEVSTPSSMLERPDCRQAGRLGAVTVAPTWRAVASTFVLVAIPSRWRRTPWCATRLIPIRRIRGQIRRPGRDLQAANRGRHEQCCRRGLYVLGTGATSPGESTTSCEAGRDARAIQASRVSICRSKMTSCAFRRDRVPRSSSGSTCPKMCPSRPRSSARPSSGLKARSSNRTSRFARTFSNTTRS